MHRTIIWRRVLALDLGLYNIGIFLFAWLPPETLNLNEKIAMAASLFAFLGVVARALRRIDLPFEEWSYFITMLVGAYVFLGYVTSAPDTYDDKIPFGVFLLSGIASAFAAHVIDGGKDK